MVGIFAWYGMPVPFEARMKAIKKAGFDSTSIWIDNDNHEDIAADDIPNVVRASGLVLDYAHAPYRNINNLWDEFKSQDMEAEMKTYVDYCSRHGIPILVTHLTKGFRIAQINEYGIASLARLARYAQNRGVRIALENTKHNEVLSSVLTQLEDPILGLCYDSSHDNLYGSPKFDLLRRFPERLFCLHLADNSGLKDDHWLPFRGTVDWGAFVDAFPESYDGILNMEVLPQNKAEQNEDFLARAYASIEALRVQIERKKAAYARKPAVG